MALDEITKLEKYDYDTLYKEFIDILNQELSSQLKTPYTYDSLKNSNIGSFVTTIIKAFLIYRNYLLASEGLIRKNLNEAVKQFIYKGGANIQGLILGLKQITFNKKPALKNVAIFTKSIYYPDIPLGCMYVVLNFVNPELENNTDLSKKIINYLAQNVAAGAITIPYPKYPKAIKSEVVFDILTAPIPVAYNIAEILKLTLEIKAKIYSNQNGIAKEEIKAIEEAILLAFNTNSNKHILNSQMLLNSPLFNNMYDITIKASYKTTNEDNKEIEIVKDITSSYLKVKPVQIINIDKIIIKVTPESNPNV